MRVKLGFWLMGKLGRAWVGAWFGAWHLVVGKLGRAQVLAKIFVLWRKFISLSLNTADQSRPKPNQTDAIYAK